MAGTYDVIVVGARVAGAATARLLAQRGHRVLVVDRATFPSDTVSTHAIDPVGMALLDQWGLTEKVFATNTPRVTELMLTSGGQEFAAQAPRELACPRRTVLDNLLVDEVRAAGGEVREGVTVKQLLRDDTGKVTGIAGANAAGEPIEERAQVVVGADGMHSFVARQVGPEQYGERCGKGSGYYAYYARTGLDAMELAFGDGTFVGIFPTNDDLVCVFAGRNSSEFAKMRSDPDEALVTCVSEASARLGDAVRGAKRDTRFFKYDIQPGFFRKPYGDGWALVGDAGFHIDPVTGRGIGHAFRDAARLARAVDTGLGGHEPLDDALAAYHADRDRMSEDVFRITHDIADLEWKSDAVVGLMLELMTITPTLVDEVNAWAEASQPGRA